MGSDMKTRKKICSTLYKRYQKADKKTKGKILDEYVLTLGLNRDYLATCSQTWEKPSMPSQMENP